MKLELKYLAGYLPYDLNMDSHGRKYILNGFMLESLLNVQDKPILRPLSDLTKEIEVNGEKSIYLVEIMKIKENGDWIGLQYKKIDENPFYVIQKLLEWHFDIYELIKNGLAIDINTLDK